MALEVKLFKQEGKYTDKKDGKEKRFVNFYLQCGDKNIPVDIRYFPNEKCDGRDPEYAGRKAVLETFAERIPDKISIND